MYKQFPDARYYKTSDDAAMRSIVFVPLSTSSMKQRQGQLLK